MLKRHDRQSFPWWRCSLHYLGGLLAMASRPSKLAVCVPQPSTRPHVVVLKQPHVKLSSSSAAYYAPLLLTVAHCNLSVVHSARSGMPVAEAESKAGELQFKMRLNLPAFAISVAYPGQICIHIAHCAPTR